MHLLGISGSLRSASLNTVLVQEAARVFAPELFEMADLHLPLYSGDVEDAGMPKAVQTLSDQIGAADAVVISTPEYNANLSGVLKNALDWVSRTAEKPWAGKPVAIMSATAGMAGGPRAQNSLRQCMQPFNPHLLYAPEVMIGAAYDAFKDGQLQNERSITLMRNLMVALRAAAQSNLS